MSAMLSFPGHVGGVPDATSRQLYGLGEPPYRVVRGGLTPLEAAAIFDGSDQLIDLSTHYSHSSNVYALLLVQVVFTPLVQYLLKRVYARTGTEVAPSEVERIVDRCRTAYLTAVRSHDVNDPAFSVVGICRIAVAALQNAARDGNIPRRGSEGIDLTEMLDDFTQRVKRELPGGPDSGKQVDHITWATYQTKLPSFVTRFERESNPGGIDDTTRDELVTNVARTVGEFLMRSSDGVPLDVIDDAIRRHTPAVSAGATSSESAPTQLPNSSTLRHLLSLTDLMERMCTREGIHLGKHYGARFGAEFSTLGAGSPSESRGIAGSVDHLGVFFSQRSVELDTGRRGDASHSTVDEMRRTLEDIRSSQRNDVDKYNAGFAAGLIRESSSAYARTFLPDVNRSLAREMQTLFDSISERDVLGRDAHREETMQDFMYRQTAGQLTTATSRVYEFAGADDEPQPISATLPMHIHTDASLSQWRGTAHYVLHRCMEVLNLYVNLFVTHWVVFEDELHTEVATVVDDALPPTVNQEWKDAFTDFCLSATESSVMTYITNVHNKVSLADTLFRRGLAKNNLYMGSPWLMRYAWRMETAEICTSGLRHASGDDHSARFAEYTKLVQRTPCTYNGPVTQLDVELITVYCVQMLRDRWMMKHHLDVDAPFLDTDLPLARAFLQYVLEGSPLRNTDIQALTDWIVSIHATCSGGVPDAALSNNAALENNVDVVDSSVGDDIMDIVDQSMERYHPRRSHVLSSRAELPDDATDSAPDDPDYFVTMLSHMRWVAHEQYVDMTDTALAVNANTYFTTHRAHGELSGMQRSDAHAVPGPGNGNVWQRRKSRADNTSIGKDVNDAINRALMLVLNAPSLLVHYIIHTTADGDAHAAEQVIDVWRQLLVHDGRKNVHMLPRVLNTVHGESVFIGGGEHATVHVDAEPRRAFMQAYFGLFGSHGASTLTLAWHMLFTHDPPSSSAPPTHSVALDNSLWTRHLEMFDHIANMERARAWHNAVMEGLVCANSALLPPSMSVRRGALVQRVRRSGGAASFYVPHLTRIDHGTHTTAVRALVPRVDTEWSDEVRVVIKSSYRYIRPYVHAAFVCRWLVNGRVYTPRARVMTSTQHPFYVGDTVYISYTLRSDVDALSRPPTSPSTAHVQYVNVVAEVTPVSQFNSSLRLTNEMHMSSRTMRLSTTIALPHGACIIGPASG